MMSLFLQIAKPFILLGKLLYFSALFMWDHRRKLAYLGFFSGAFFSVLGIAANSNWHDAGLPFWDQPDWIPYGITLAGFLLLGFTILGVVIAHIVKFMREHKPWSVVGTMAIVGIFLAVVGIMLDEYQYDVPPGLRVGEEVFLVGVLGLLLWAVTSLLLTGWQEFWSKQSWTQRIAYTGTPVLIVAGFFAFLIGALSSERSLLPRIDSLEEKISGMERTHAAQLDSAVVWAEQRTELLPESLMGKFQWRDLDRSEIEHWVRQSSALTVDQVEGMYTSYVGKDLVRAKVIGKGLTHFIQTLGMEERVVKGVARIIAECDTLPWKDAWLDKVQVRHQCEGEWEIEEIYTFSDSTLDDRPGFERRVLRNREHYVALRAAAVELCRELDPKADEIFAALKVKPDAVLPAPIPQHVF